MTYCHTQKGKLHHFGNVGAVLLLWASLTAQTTALELLAILLAALLMLFLVACFAEMTVRDAGDHLLIRYGPIPLVRVRVPYASIESVRLGRSAWIDGLGIHFLPWRGWTYNVWGFACAELHLRGRRNVLRIGSDDAAALVHFLERRVDGAARPGGESTAADSNRPPPVSVP